MGKSVKAPPSPDFTGAAQAQGQANLASGLQSAQLSNPNINSPYGTQTVTYDGTIPTVTQQLTPTGQQTVNQQQQADLGLATLANQQTGSVGNILNTPFGFGGQPQSQLDLSGVAKAPINGGTTAQDAIMSRLQPQLDRQRTSTETGLINQGLRPGSEAYDNAIKDLGQQENDQRTQAALQGLNLDMSANQQGFNQALQGGQFGNTAVNQQLAQALQLRDQPLNEISGLMSGSQIQNPQFAAYQGQNVAPAPVMQGVQNQASWDQNLYNQQVAQQNSGLSGLFGLGGSILGGPLGGLLGKGIGKLF